MRSILMILTSHRMRCLGLCLDLLERADAFKAFDHTVLLLNGVRPRHRRLVAAYMRARPSVSWDIVTGPGGRIPHIAVLENECVRRYPGSFYVKIDEDIFVPDGWAGRMLEAYAAHRDDEDLALITPLIPNQDYGLHALLTRYYPDLLETYRRTFGGAPCPEILGTTWARADVGEWATRQFLHLADANARHRRLLHQGGHPRFRRFADRFSIGCIGFDFRHHARMGGVPPRDEEEWCAWIGEHGGRNVLDAGQIVLHYSFFTQQRQLDRSHLLEDIRRVNLPETLPVRRSLAYYRPWLGRLAGQASEALKGGGRSFVLAC